MARLLGLFDALLSPTNTARSTYRMSAASASISENGGHCAAYEKREIRKDQDAASQGRAARLGHGQRAGRLGRNNGDKRQ